MSKTTLNWRVLLIFSKSLDEQCYRIPELEDDDRDHDEDDDDDHPGDGESPGWEPLRTFTSSEGETGHEQASDEPVQPDEDDHEQDRVGLKEPDEISSGSMQNPHDGRDSPPEGR